MKALILILGFLGCVVTGCSTIRQTASTAGSGTNMVRVTTLTVKTLGDAKQVIESLRASNGATQTLGASGVQTESTSEMMKDLVTLATMAAKAYSGVPGPVPTVPPSQPLPPLTPPGK